MPPRGRTKRAVVQSGKLKDSALGKPPEMVSRSKNYTSEKQRRILQSDIAPENDSCTVISTLNLL